MSKDVLLGLDARSKLLEGVEILANAVSSTLGPKGRNVLIEKSYGAPRVTKDGVTVAKEIELEDKLQNIGARMVREVASRTVDSAGDGTTTATVLAHAIYKEGLRSVVAGMNPMDIKRGIDFATDRVIEELSNLKKDVSTNEQIVQIGTISANGETEIGEMLAKAINKVGKEGVITIEESKSIDTELEIVEGMQFDRGYISPHFSTNFEKMTAELEEPYILLYEKKISSIQSILPLLEGVVQASASLLVVAEDVDGEALAALIVNKLRGGLKVAAVKAPGFGDRRKEMLQDIAILTGGTVVSEDTGMKLENVQISDLGRCNTVKITKDLTTIVDGRGTKKEIADRCKQLRTQIDDVPPGYDREKLQERLAKLSGGVAVVKVGGATEVEQKEKKDRVEDAMYATKAAVQEGIVPGGGVALLYASRVLEGLTGDNDDQTVGIKIVKRAVQEPLRKIVQNSGTDGVIVAGKLLDQASKTKGYNAQTGEYVDMFDTGIIDPFKVVRLALQNATSVAGLMLTTDAVITDRPEKKQNNSHE